MPDRVTVEDVCLQHQKNAYTRSAGLVMEEQSGSAGSSPQQGRGSGRQDVLRCGWLRKQGGFVKTWHTRWFVLRGDQLYYYKDEDETKALGTISLPGNRVTEHPSSGDEGGKFLFEVIPGKRKCFYDVCFCNKALALAFTRGPR
ncbi:putative rho GTPase-activating protein 24-like [Triplophysa rosa]|uniref:Rho GTPase-activating protein 24-like n=1 Tax=Triplophysa rosa TaxID=992332 RepID=A0A9W7TFU7_TRIRA|nr:putative rho GTPase-activating protein 24-like [Triplophysa rosa]